MKHIHTYESFINESRTKISDDIIRYAKSLTPNNGAIAESYKPVPSTMKIAGKFEIEIKGKKIETLIAGFERENDDSDSLYLMDSDPLKDEHGSFIVKNSDMPKLSKGKEVDGKCSKHGIPVKLKRIGDL